ncbi:MAG: hypothetical protein ABIB43_04820 [archaeon]
MEKDIAYADSVAARKLAYESDENFMEERVAHHKEEKKVSLISFIGIEMMLLDCIYLSLGTMYMLNHRED